MAKRREPPERFPFKIPWWLNLMGIPAFIGFIVLTGVDDPTTCEEYCWFHEREIVAHVKEVVKRGGHKGWITLVDKSGRNFGFHGGFEMHRLLRVGDTARKPSHSMIWSVRGTVNADSVSLPVLHAFQGDTCDCAANNRQQQTPHPTK